MKRHGRLFDEIFTAENLYQGYLAARKKKRSSRACYLFEKALGDNIARLLDEVHGNLYQPSPYHTFQVYEPKPRLIHAPAFRDRVVQHAIYSHIYPTFNQSFLQDSYACRVGFGTHKASSCLQGAMRQCSPDDYFLQLDIRKFFYRIDRDILLTLLERKIKDTRLLDMMMLFAYGEGPIGIPIGNLLSQLYALVYLDPLDHFVKRELKAKHYLRYVDDFILIGYSRQECFALRAIIEEFLSDVLRLELSKSTIQKISKGINFVGYRTWRSRKLVRRHSLYKFRRAVKKNDVKAVVSLIGHAKHTESMPHLCDVLSKSSINLPRKVSKKLKEGEYHAL